MPQVPKPAHCKQNWLTMNPTEGGRVCGKCEKVIIDFSKMSWREIEQIQAANNNSVCGIYASKQLDYWGQEIPSSSCSKFAASVSLLAAITLSVPGFGQSTSLTSEKTLIKGQVLGEEDREPVVFSTVYLKGTQIGVITDEQGNYQLEIPDSLELREHPTLVFKNIEYETLEIPVAFKKNSITFQNALLIREEMEINAFYVRKPTFYEQVKYKISSWFGR